MANRQLFLKAATTAQHVGQIVDERLRPVGIPAFLLALLTHIRDNAPVSPSTLSQAAGTPTTTLRDNIQRLVDRGLARRIPNPDDRRSYLLVLTRKGDATLLAADPALLEAYLALERHLPRPLEHYERVLDELNDALRASLEAAPESSIEAPAPVSAPN